MDEAPYEKPLSLVRKNNRAAVGWLQIELRIGVRKAMALRDLMERRGVIKSLPNGRVEVLYE